MYSVSHTVQVKLSIASTVGRTKAQTGSRLTQGHTANLDQSY